MTHPSNETWILKSPPQLGGAETPEWTATPITTIIHFTQRKRVMKQTRHFSMLETILVDLMIGLTVGMAIPAAILVALTTPIEIAIRGIQKLLAAFSLAFRDASAVLLILFRE